MGTPIQRNNEIQQEFYFANPETKNHINNIYNLSFTGSPLWDLFSETSESLEKTYNKSIRLMWDVPIETHKYLIEPISQQTHLKFTLIKRFMKFKEQVMKSSKSVLKHLFKICENDCGSVTGGNFRKIMLLCQKETIHDLRTSDLDNLTYQTIPENEMWRLSLIQELLEIRRNDLELNGFSEEEVSSLIDIVCGS